ncbi:MAG: hypothetical protein IT307_12660 [Chloroflexi bacterium]|nr:hypothetical protein [Chloroflexota bacterium]
MRYHEDGLTGGIVPLFERCCLVERNPLARLDLSRRSQSLPVSCCRLLTEVETLAVMACRADER